MGTTFLSMHITKQEVMTVFQETTITIQMGPVEPAFLKETAQSLRANLEYFLYKQHLL